MSTMGMVTEGGEPGGAEGDQKRYFESSLTARMPSFFLYVTVAFGEVMVVVLVCRAGASLGHLTFCDWAEQVTSRCELELPPRFTDQGTAVDSNCLIRYVVLRALHLVHICVYVYLSHHSG